MFIFKTTRKRANPYVPYTDETGTKYLRIPLELLEEIPDPTPPEDYSDDTYYRTETDEVPYVVYLKKSNKQLKQLRNNKRKQQIEHIESKQMRALRDAILSGNKTYLQAIEDQIVALRDALEDETED